MFVREKSLSDVACIRTILYLPSVYKNLIEMGASDPLT